MAEKLRRLHLGGRQPSAFLRQPLTLQVPEAVRSTPDELLLLGRLDDRWTAGVVHHHFARVHGKHFLMLWIYHLGNCLYEDGGGTQSYLLGRASSKHFRPLETYRFLPTDRAQQLLGGLVRIFFEGLRRPLPLFPKSSFHFAKTSRQGGYLAQRALQTAQRIWSDEERSRDPYLQRVFPTDSVDPWDQPDMGEQGTRLSAEFQRLSCEVFDPLLDHLEELS